MESLARNKTFRPQNEPLRRTTTLGLASDKVQGPISFLNPTRARFTQVQPSLSETDVPTVTIPSQAANDQVPALHEQPTGFKPPQPTLTYQWTSRDARKGRQTVLIDKDEITSTGVAAPVPTSSIWPVLKNIGRMLTSFPIWDISFDVAILFTVGSAIWILNGLFVLLPLTNPSSDFPGEALYGGGITAFIGGLVFLAGGVLMAVEQLYEHPSNRPGSAEEGRTRFVPRNDSVTGAIVRRPTQRNPSIISLTSAFPATPDAKRSWKWLPSLTELRTHYLHSLGFLACVLLLISIIVFSIACIVSLPPIYKALNTPAKRIGAYWAPQVVGGVGFVVAGAMFMVETQERWWLPALGLLGWHIGLWNLVGGLGFTLCPIFGLLGSKWALYQASLSSFWGSCAFFIGSVVQWYESLNKLPVETMKAV